MKTQLNVVAALAFVVSLFGAVSPLMAEPDESQRLRGLEGRVFLVDVEQVSGFPVEPEPYENCYVFDADGYWYESGASPVAGGQSEGFWTQDSIGASTPYLVEALGNGFLPVEQVGQVNPALGGGVLQLVAFTTVDLTVIDPALGLVEFFSMGYEIDLETAVGACPGWEEP